jgi:hypothetical protein
MGLERLVGFTHMSLDKSGSVAACRALSGIRI